MTPTAAARVRFAIAAEERWGVSQFDSSRTGDASGKMAGCRERLQTSLAEKSDGHPQFRLRSRQPELVSGAA